MWFVFPQLRGLGRSAMAHRYGIASRAEAVAYLDHPLLGTRLVECTGLMLAAPQRLTANAILGAPDDLKFRSSMTLFGAVAGRERALRRRFLRELAVRGRARAILRRQRRRRDAAPARRPLKRVRPARTGGAGLHAKRGLRLSSVGFAERAAGVLALRRSAEARLNGRRVR